MSDLGLWLGEPAVFDATVETVPFLRDLEVTDSVTDRSGLIKLLLTILEHANPPRIEVQQAAHRAVLDGRSMADVLGRDGDAAVRAAALSVVGAEVRSGSVDEAVVCGPCGVLRRGECLHTRGGIDYVVGGDDHRLCSDVDGRVGHEKAQRNICCAGMPMPSATSCASSSTFVAKPRCWS
ncbi:hypothetical protein ABWJ92_33955 [Streptomyces sp. NPDC000609]|uniref:hypothetical protein n=1 Tax=Streptomyces sp. NPDC000609 TaxID=3160957 RepID=UPI003397C293